MRDVASLRATAGASSERSWARIARLQLAGALARFEPELLARRCAAVLEDAERVGLPTGPVQREHEQAPEPLAQRMRGDELFELDDHALVPTERELEVEPLLDRREPQLGQPRDGRRRELLVGEVGKRVAAPQRVGFGEQRRRRVRITVDRGRLRRGDQCS